MDLAVVPVNHEKESQEFVGFLTRVNPSLPHETRFDWLYRHPPGGNPRSWFLIDRKTGSAVGAASVFPRFLMVGHRLLRCGQVGDFAVDAAYRTLGPALMLQRATLEPVRNGELDVCYDCPPHELGMSTFLRLGMRENCEMLRYARLLSTDRQFQSIFGCGRVARLFSTVGNGIVFSTTRRRTYAAVEISTHTGRFGDEFSELDRRLTTETEIRNRRSAEDLNWRFHDDPLNTYVTITARRKGELVGFLVHASAGGDCTIVDVCGTTEIAAALIETVIFNGQQEHRQVLNVVLSEHNPLTAILRKLGFYMRQRQARVVAACYANDADLLQNLQRRNVWAFTQADILS